ncbi:flagellar basal body P-ring formation chaperone FlgA [Celeribacter marinus]|uniref:flagellar basal body P-ring formation chaperone FlgA n=1 Tax=Celeribacter marinus TaxID=1397108 RepID=UPI003F6C3549
MIRFAIIALVATLALPASAHADTLVAARNIRAQTLLSADDLKVVGGDIAGTLISVEEAVGLEAKGMLYAGRPIRITDVGAPALIERNAIVPLHFTQGSLTISADARSLSRAGIGDTVRVMNLSSKTIVTGIVGPNGAVHVGRLTTQ